MSRSGVLTIPYVWLSRSVLNAGGLRQCHCEEATTTEIGWISFKAGGREGPEATVGRTPPEYFRAFSTASAWNLEDRHKSLECRTPEVFQNKEACKLRQPVPPSPNSEIVREGLYAIVIATILTILKTETLHVWDSRSSQSIVDLFYTQRMGPSRQKGRRWSYWALRQTNSTTTRTKITIASATVPIHPVRGLGEHAHAEEPMMLGSERATKGTQLVLGVEGGREGETHERGEHGHRGARGEKQGGREPQRQSGTWARHGLGNLRVRSKSNLNSTRLDETTGDGLKCGVLRGLARLEMWIMVMQQTVFGDCLKRMASSALVEDGRAGSLARVASPEKGLRTPTIIVSSDDVLATIHFRQPLGPFLGSPRLASLRRNCRELVRVDFLPPRLLNPTVDPGRLLSQEAVILVGVHAVLDERLCFVSVDSPTSSASCQDCGVVILVREKDWRLKFGMPLLEFLHPLVGCLAAIQLLLESTLPTETT
ncbi:hypothetical protein C8R46DRAFT_1048650 [Mycena filopes]|nr:hypothetical protein C8R46DRAFT_1048650 [Mycena filopes]